MDSKQLMIGKYLLLDVAVKRIEPANESNNWEPIELSRDWFEKLGFEVEECETGLVYYSISDAIQSESYPEFQDFTIMFDGQRHYFLSESFQIPLDYVHELQNMYFVLTRGKQLKIKEDEG